MNLWRLINHLKKEENNNTLNNFIKNELNNIKRILYYIINGYYYK